jgi:hypothetical protein
MVNIYLRYGQKCRGPSFDSQCKANPPRIHNNKSTTFDKSYNLLYNKFTVNPQQIEQVEFELNWLNCCFT